MKRVVITGMGAITPIGNNISSYWESLKAGVSGSAPITKFDASDFKTRFACEVKDYDPLNYFERKEARKMDLFNQYGMIAADEAIQNSGIDFEKVDKNRAGIIWSTGIGGFETFETEIEQYGRMGGIPRLSPFFITKIIANGLAGQLSIKYGLRGVNYTPVTACASSTQAIIQAYNYIKWGKMDTVLAGGSEAPITKASVAGFNSMKALSTNNEEYATACRPFDSSRDGFVMGEGAAGVMIESLDHAMQRNAPILAEIVGGGESSDAYHITGTHPEGLGAVLAMRAALEEAQIAPGDIDYVNAHATSTGLGDISEIKAFEQCFEGNISGVKISATKSMTGHLLGAAGAVEAVASILALKNNTIPPTINTNEVDESISSKFDLTLNTAGTGELNYALSNSFGFGGHCAALILKDSDS